MLENNSIVKKIKMKIALPIHVRLEKAGFSLRISKAYLAFYHLYYLSLLKKKCFFGPFTGEFGHLLGHNLPFVAHLYSKGVKIEFCGMEMHECFFVDEKGKSIVTSFTSLRDFFKESAPSSNKAKEPADIQEITSNFRATAKRSALPFWSNDNFDLYFYAFRWWALKNKFCKVFDLSKVYKTKDERSVVIFPRKWNSNFPEMRSKQLKNNGENWNYFEVAKAVSKIVDKVYVIGHPQFSHVDFDSFDNVEVCITNDNRFILEKCCNSKLIITQHSGSVYLGEYTDCQVLIIYKGGREIGEIEMTEKFKNGLGTKYPFAYAFSLEEIESFTKNYEAFRN